MGVRKVVRFIRRDPIPARRPALSWRIAGKTTFLVVVLLGAGCAGGGQFPKACRTRVDSCLTWWHVFSQVRTGACTRRAFAARPDQLTHGAMRASLNHAGENGPARIRTWVKRIMSPLL